MALSTYLCAKSYGKPSPQFLSSSEEFPHGSIVCNVNSELRRRRIWKAVQSVSTAATPSRRVSGKGILQTEYGVNLNTITWAATDDEHVAEYQAPANVDYSRRARPSVSCCVRDRRTVGDIRPDPPDIQRLIPDAAMQFCILSENRDIPINHAL